jgi:hypothetical protein
MFEGIYYVVPNLNNFNIRAEAANSVTLSFSYVVWAVLYGLMYTGMLLILYAIVFEDKDV